MDHAPATGRSIKSRVNQNQKRHLKATKGLSIGPHTETVYVFYVL